MSATTDKRFDALASTRRTGHFARTKSRKRIERVLQTSWRILFALGAVGLATTTVAALLGPAGFQRGLVVGVGGLGTAWMLTALVLSSAGTAPMRRGAEAEAWTVQELAPVLPHGWRLINHVQLTTSGSDIDHVLVGPGGLFVLETKWTAETWTARSPRARDACTQVREQAHRLRPLPEVKAAGCEPTPLVVHWGPAEAELMGANGLVLHGVRILHGSQLRAWMLRRGRGVLSPDASAAVSETFARLADQTDGREEPAPRTVEELAADLGGPVATAVGTLLVVSQVAAASLIVGLGTLVLTCGLAALVRHRTRFRHFGTAALIGVGAYALIVAVAATLTTL